MHRAAGAALAATLALTACSGAEPRAETKTPTPRAASTSATSTVPAPSSRGITTSSRRLDRPLLRASRRGDAERVADLLAGGASVRARDRTGATALVRAAYGNHLDVAALLIAAGADVNRKDRTEQSAYLISTSEVGDDPRLLAMTLAAGGDVRSLDGFDGTGLIRAADRGYPAVVRRLLETDIRVDHVNNLGWTALHEAVILGDGSRRYVRTVRLLVDAGADVNKPSRRDGVRPLQHAQRRGFTAIARALRSAGAS